jgi:hypothetical protein
MRAVADYKKRAEECRQLAKLTAKPEDWQHFPEMAETWEMLAKHREIDLEWEKRRAADSSTVTP